MPSFFAIAFRSEGLQLPRTVPLTPGGNASLAMTLNVTGENDALSSIRFLRLFNSGSCDPSLPSGGQNQGFSNCGVGLFGRFGKCWPCTKQPKTKRKIEANRMFSLLFFNDVSLLKVESSGLAPYITLKAWLQ